METTAWLISCWRSAAWSSPASLRKRWRASTPTRTPRSALPNLPDCCVLLPRTSAPRSSVPPCAAWSPVALSRLLAAMHGFRDERSGGFLEERIDRRGLYYFTLRTAGKRSRPWPGWPIRTARHPRQARHSASRPAGTRRVQVSILVRPGTACVVMTVFGVTPDKPQLFEVNGEGLRHVVRDALCDPGGDPRSDVTREAGPPYRCPVCGYLGLFEPPRTEEAGGIVRDLSLVRL